MTKWKRRIVAGVGVLGLGLCMWILFRPLAGPGMITPRLADFLLLPGPGIEVPGDGLKVAVASFSANRDKADNLAAIDRISRRALHEHADLDLIVFGEAALGLYHDPRSPAAYQRSLAEPVPGPSSQKVSELARELGVYIAYGHLL